MNVSPTNPRPPPRRRWRKAGVVAFLLLALTTLAGTGGLYWSEELLLVEHRAAKADVIVLLGGDPNFRHPRALELYHQGFAPVILLSGVGEDGWMKRWFISQGVPESAIHTELVAARTTKENADISAASLRAWKVRRVILVTSWFHSRRAVACFRQSIPEMEFISLPTVHDRPPRHWPVKVERNPVLIEYLKLGVYWIRFGTTPFH